MSSLHDHAITPPPSTPLYILAGGRSSRFGSDKARAMLDGEALIRRVAFGLWPTAERVVVVADEADRYADLGLHTLGDDRPMHGPLAGLHRALAHRVESSGPGWVVLSSCDLLQPRPSWVRPLIDAASDLSATAYVDASGRWQPLPGVYHTAILPAVTEALDGPSRSLWRVLESVAAQRVALPEGVDRVPQANTPEQLAAARLDSGRAAEER